MTNIYMLDVLDDKKKITVLMMNNSETVISKVQ